MKNIFLSRTALLLFGSSLLYLTACSEPKSEDQKIQSAELQEPAPQTEQEREYILSNKKAINTAAYLFNLIERYANCKNQHVEIQKQSKDNEIILSQWAAKIDQQFEGELGQQIIRKLDTKVKIKIAEDKNINEPTLEQCQALHKKISINDITPDARRMVAE